MLAGLSLPYLQNTLRDTCSLQEGASPFSRQAPAGEATLPPAVQFTPSAAHVAAMQSPFKEASLCLIHSLLPSCILALPAP